MESWWFLLSGDNACFAMGVDSYEALDVAEALKIAPRRGIEALKLTTYDEYSSHATGLPEPPDWIRGRLLYFQKWEIEHKRLFLVGYGETRRRLLVKRYSGSVAILREVQEDWGPSKLAVGDMVQIRKDAWERALPHIPYAGTNHQITWVADGGYFLTIREGCQYWWKRNELEQAPKIAPREVRYEAVMKYHQRILETSSRASGPWVGGAYSCVHLGAGWR